MDSVKEAKKFDAIVCLSQIDWDFLWQRTQEIMSQFAAMGYPVLFVENTGVRVPGFKDAPRVWNRIKNVFSDQKKVPSIERHVNIEILSPMVLPFPYSTIAVKWNTNLLRSSVLRFSRQKNIPLQRILLWSYMTTPLAVSIADTLPWAGIVIDLVSDPCKICDAEALKVSHRKMLELADVVLCASFPMVNTAKQQLGEGKQYKVRLFEDGFSTRLLDITQDECEEIDLPVHNKKSPKVAYIGGVNDKIWWEAVTTMARAFPEINFVFVGPKEVNELPCEGTGKNVFWLPPFEEYSQLGHFLKRCKAGLIPYRVIPYISEMRPAKINEYLVMGLPIVATKLPEIERFGQESGPGIAYLAESTNEFIVALRHALEKDCQDYREKRLKIAQSRSWEIECKKLENYLIDLIQEECTFFKDWCEKGVLKK